jgi:hypothetical protein
VKLVEGINGFKSGRFFKSSIHKNRRMGDGLSSQLESNDCKSLSGSLMIRSLAALLIDYPTARKHRRLIVYVISLLTSLTNSFGAISQAEAGRQSCHTLMKIRVSPRFSCSRFLRLVHLTSSRHSRCPIRHLVCDFSLNCSSRRSWSLTLFQGATATSQVMDLRTECIRNPIVHIDG